MGAVLVSENERPSRPALKGVIRSLVAMAAEPEEVDGTAPPGAFTTGTVLTESQ